jgi:hypothetical protein
MSLIDCKFHLEKLFAKSPQRGWPHGKLTIITHNSKQDDSVKAAKSDLECLDPCVMPISVSQFQITQIFSDLLDCLKFR